MTKVMRLWILLVVALLPSVARAQMDEFDGLRQRWKELLTGDASYDPSDPDIAARIAGIDQTALSNWGSMATGEPRTYLWSDLASTTISAHVTSSYNRLKAMAVALATRGSSLEGRPDLAAAIVDGLEWMNANRYNTTRPNYDNWWDWQIGTPLALNDTVVLVYDWLSGDQIASYMAAIERFSPTVTLTAANRVWKATVVAIRGVIVKSATKLVAARNGLSDLPSQANSVFRYVASSDGFYIDGSFIQHGRHPYTGGYGNAQLANLGNLMFLLAGSTWGITDPNHQNVYAWIYDAFQPLLYEGGMMSMVRGREISRSGAQDHNTGHTVMQSILRIAQFAPEPDAYAFKSMVKRWIQTDTFRNFFQFASVPMIALGQQIVNDPTIEPRGELVWHKRYPRMDRVVHLRPGFGFGLSMSSSRIYNYECINNENLHGWYTADGMTFLYNADLGQYSNDFSPTVDPYRLAGTTVDRRTRGNCSGQSYLSPRNWAGGTDLWSAFGTTGMELKAWSSPLSARKSWFMFDDEIVALGSGINDTDAYTVETTVENRRLGPAADEPLTVNWEVKPSTLGWSEPMSDVSWIHLAGTGGYYFPQAVTVRAKREARTGQWRDINNNGSTTSITRNYLTLWLDHGVQPVDAGYAYVILPNKADWEVADYAAAPQVTVVENSPEAHAVRENTWNILGVNFWNDGWKTVDLLTVDRKASAMTFESGNEIELAISDPTQAASGITWVELARDGAEVIFADPRMSVYQLSPSIWLMVDVTNARGATIGARFRLNQ